MNPNGVLLEHTLKEILAVLQPESNDWVARFQVIEELRRVVDSLESMRGATVEPFGSFVSNLFTRSADLDISIELANGSFISSSGKKHKQKLLRALMKAMRQRGGWNKYQCIPNARVPILKVQSNIQNISCDISVDNLQAQMKSKMLLWITEIDTRFRDMVLLVKEWAKAHNINNSKTGTFNSYSLSLLVVFHFQVFEENNWIWASLPSKTQKLSPRKAQFPPKSPSAHCPAEPSREPPAEMKAASQQPPRVNLCRAAGRGTQCSPVTARHASGGVRMFPRVRALDAHRLSSARVLLTRASAGFCFLSAWVPHARAHPTALRHVSLLSPAYARFPRTLPLRASFSSRASSLPPRGPAVCHVSPAGEWQCDTCPTLQKHDFFSPD